MKDDYIYHYKKSRRQQAHLFIRMGAFCWLYIAALYAYDYLAATPVPVDLKLAAIGAFSAAGVILFLVAWWHFKHPAEYEACITRDTFTVLYPSYPAWSFSVDIQDIKRFENRQSLGHAGKGIMQHGILLNDGRFFHISMNYGNKLGEMYRAVKSIKPDVEYPSTVNKKVLGMGLDREYKD